jgi:tRNA (guanine37-N1)-methyltransferase
MRFDVLTLFPSLIHAYTQESVIGNALDAGYCQLFTHNPRDYAQNKHKKVDDTPYGGGAGMLLSVQPFYDCLKAVQNIDPLNKVLNERPTANREIIIFSPRGETFTQALASDLAQKEQIIMLCGHYEGFDERIYSLSTRVVSLGDFILTGGELAALTLIDAVSRLVPKVLGSSMSSHTDSFSRADDLFELDAYEFTKAELKALELLIKDYGIGSWSDFKGLCLLEYPHYTRPEIFNELKVPAVLKSGDHKKILFWRIEEALKITKKYRPDLLKR